MRKDSIFACALALMTTGATMWAISRPSGDVLEPTIIQERIVPEITCNKARANATESETSLYWTEAKSYYNDGHLDPENGTERQFGSRVEIEGNKATIYGLVDLYFDEVDEEYGIEGTYDYRTSTVTIEGTNYDSSLPVGSFIKIADMYSLSKNENYTLVLFAGDMYGQQLETIDKLVFRVSEDLSTLTSQTGYGAYAFNASGEPMAFYDYYQPGVVMSRATSDSGLSTSTNSLDFNGLFVAANMPVKQSMYLYNRSNAETTFSITSSSDQLTASVTEGTIGACSSRSVEITFAPTEAGRFEGAITISSPSLTDPISVTVDLDVWEQPDYTKITKSGSAEIRFDMSPVYPFIITEYDGHVAAKSTNNGHGNNTQSYFICYLDIPLGQTGVFSWDAVQFTSQPNTLTVYLDGEPIKYDYYVHTSQAVDMSGLVALPEGNHEVVFSQEIDMDWSMYDEISEGYVWNLDFQLMESKDNLAYLENATADFGTTYYDGLTIQKETSAKLINLGTSPLKVTEVRGAGHFSGTVPAISVPQGGEIILPLIWNVSALGVDSDDVVIVTTAGEFTVHCTGLGQALPYNYSQFVKEGTIAFNTGVEWPFKISDNGRYLYNSTSMADIDGITECWLEAIFDVPEGKVGMFAWDAVNDSEDLFVFMNTPSVVSGSKFLIDGKYEEMVGGIGVNCASSDIYTPDKLTFKNGRHCVRFTYKKTSNDEGYIFGDDRLKLFEFGLKLEDADAHRGDLTSTAITYPDEVLVGCAGHFGVTLINYTTETPTLISSQCDGPFTTKTIGVNDGNLNMMIEFVPTTGGNYSNELTISTNIGDYKISCTGQAKESTLGKAIFYESFEYDFGSNWVMTDANKDNNTWEAISPNIEAFEYELQKPYDGNDGLMLKGFDPNTYDYYDTDDYASTPTITIPADGVTTLRFMLKSFSYMDQGLDVLAGEGKDINTYQTLERISLGSPTMWEAYQVDLSVFAGKTIRIAFRGYDIANVIAIDDVLVASTGTLSGLTNADTNKEVTSIEYYSPLGVRLDRPTSGACIVVTRYADGTCSTEKRIVIQ